MEDPDRVGYRDLRLPGDIPQPSAPSFGPGDAYSGRVRSASPNHPTRGLKPSNTTPGNPGHISLFRTGCNATAADRSKSRHGVTQNALHKMVVRATMTDSGGNVLSEANGLMIKLLPHQP